MKFLFSILFMGFSLINIYAQTPLTLTKSNFNVTGSVDAIYFQQGPTSLVIPESGAGKVLGLFKNSCNFDNQCYLRRC